MSRKSNELLSPRASLQSANGLEEALLHPSERDGVAGEAGKSPMHIELGR